MLVRLLVFSGSGGDAATQTGVENFDASAMTSFGVTAAPLAPGNVDTITDFTSGSDTIELDHTLFASLTTTISGATISNAEFAAGANLTSSMTEGTVLLYNWTTGALYYDADANGSGAGELIAILGNAPGLVAADIDIM